MSSVSIAAFDAQEFLRTNSCIEFRNERISGFHRDAILCDFMIKLLRHYDIFVETGTYLGITCDYVSLNSPGTILHSCELSRSNYEAATLQCSVRKNVSITHSDSLSFLGQIDKAVPRDAIPVFWLDAHSDEDDDPTVLREVELITQKYKNYVILIDDLKNPRVEGCNAQIRSASIIDTLNSAGAVWPKYSATHRFQGGRLDFDPNPSCSSWCMITSENITSPLFEA